MNEQLGLHQYGSSGVVLPGERSIKQRHFAFCRNAQCRENGQEFHFEVQHDLFACPKCGANKPPIVGILAKVHLLVPDPKGPLVGIGGIRYRIACDKPKHRHIISTLSNHEVATGDKSQCNCVDCLVEASGAPEISGFGIHA